MKQIHQKLAIISTGGFFFIVLLLFFTTIPSGSKDILNILFGYLGGMINSIFLFYFRSNPKED